MTARTQPLQRPTRTSQPAAQDAPELTLPNTHVISTVPAWKRLQAAALDAVVFSFAIYSIASLIYGMPQIIAQYMGNQNSLEATTALLNRAFTITLGLNLTMISITACMLYSPLRATPGLYLMGYRVRSMQRPDITLQQAIMRSISTWFPLLCVTAAIGMISGEEFITFMFQMYDTTGIHTAEAAYITEQQQHHYRAYAIRAALFFMAPFVLYPLYFLAIFFNRERRTLYDILAGTRVVRVPGD